MNNFTEEYNFSNYKEYLLYIQNNYNEEDQITIENFISYYTNQYRGFGRHNCERSYQDDLKNDIDGKLHKIAMIGFQFEIGSIEKKKK